MESILPRESPRRAGHTAARGHLLIENSDESQPALAKKERSEEASLIASAPPRWSSTRRLCGRGCSLASTAATPTGTRTIFPRYPGSARAATARRASGTVHPTWAPPGAPPRGGRRARGGAPRGSRSAAAFPNPDARGGRTARRGRRSLARRRPRSHPARPFKWRWGGTSRSNAEPRARRRPPPSAASPSRCSNANTPRGLPRRTAT